VYKRQPFTSYVNVSGLPAISVPIILTEHGVPVAAQLIGRPGGEATLLRIAAQLEDRLHWADRQPEGW
jgi:amidase